MRDFPEAKHYLDSNSKFITLPMLLIVEHTWVLSFIYDERESLEIVGRFAFE
jgi:hypothetical protein